MRRLSAPPRPFTVANVTRNEEAKIERNRKSPEEFAPHHCETYDSSTDQHHPLLRAKQWIKSEWNPGRGSMRDCCGRHKCKIHVLKHSEEYGRSNTWESLNAAYCPPKVRIFRVIRLRR